MDIMLPMVNIEKEQYDKCVQALNQSDLPQVIRWDIISLLSDALQQAEYARSIGWL